MMFLHPAFFPPDQLLAIILKIQSNFGPECCEIYQMQLPEL